MPVPDDGVSFHVPYRRQQGADGSGFLQLVDPLAEQAGRDHDDEPSGDLEEEPQVDVLAASIDGVAKRYRQCQAGKGSCCGARRPGIEDDSHQEKRGTPTMGGILILVCAVVPTALWARLDNRYVLVAVLGMLAPGQGTPS